MESRKSKQRSQHRFSSAGEILIFIEGLQTKAQVPPNEEKF
jgi:hypothetical protein